MTKSALDIVASMLPAEGMSKELAFLVEVSPVADHAVASSGAPTLEMMRAALGVLPGAVKRARELASQQGGELYGFGFVLRLGGEGGTVEEGALLEQAAMHPELDGLLQAYMDATLDQRGQRLWMNDEVPAGAPAAKALALRERGHLATYEAFLRTNDMDHEVYQHEDLQELFERWGWCEALYPLVAARALTLGGQFGHEQLSMWLEELGLANHLQDPQARDRFMSALGTECARWCAKWPSRYGEQVDAARRRTRLGSDLGPLAEQVSEAELAALANTHLR